MVIWSDFRMGQYGNGDHPEDTPHFNYDRVKIFVFKKMRLIRFQKANCYQYQAHLIQNFHRLKIVLFKK